MSSCFGQKRTAERHKNGRKRRRQLTRRKGNRPEPKSSKKINAKCQTSSFGVVQCRAMPNNSPSKPHIINTNGMECPFKPKLFHIESRIFVFLDFGQQTQKNTHTNRKTDDARVRNLILPRPLATSCCCFRSCISRIRIRANRTRLELKRGYVLTERRSFTFWPDLPVAARSWINFSYCRAASQLPRILVSCCCRFCFCHGIRARAQLLAIKGGKL